MDCQCRSLFVKISALDKEFGAVLKDNDITEDEDIKALCYESMKDLLPGGGKKIIQRSKIWKIIQDSLERRGLECSPSTSASTSTDEGFKKTPKKCGSLKKHRSTSESTSTDEGLKYTPKRPCNLPSLEIETSVSAIKPVPLAPSVFLKSPNYLVYSDAEVVAGAKARKISAEVRNRLVRGTINTMNTMAAQPPFNRLPLTAELEEMAKSLIISFPCLADEETRQGVLFKQLKRRLSSDKPVKKRQGPNPNKKRFNIPKCDGEEKSKARQKVVQSLVVNCHESDTGMSETPISASEPSAVNDCGGNYYDGDLIDDKGMMERHLKALQKEMEKKNPNAKLINVYLDKEFHARWKWLEAIPPAERCTKLLDMYPCFTDHVEVIEEAQRVLEVAAMGDRFNFMGSCVDRLLDEVETLIYFGIDAKGINHPKSPRLMAKLKYIMMYLSTIFGKQKSNKKAVELLHELKDNEDPDAWSRKQTGRMPVIVVDRENIYVVVGR